MWWAGIAAKYRTRRLGRWGERRAELALRRKGLRTVGRNLRSKVGEIDLVMVDRDGQLVFVEVKTRTSERFSSGESSITGAKRQRLRRAVGAFIRLNRIGNVPMRCDVVVVIAPKGRRPQIRHYQNAFVP